MSDPVTNIQIEDVLSSIRRLVSEEIGQQPSKAPIKLTNKAEEDAKLVLSPAQKVREEAAQEGRDLWDETEEMAPQEAAPVWWHRDMSEMTSFEASEPMQLQQPVAEEPSEITASEQDDVLPDVSETVQDPVETPAAPLEGALAGLEAAKDIHDDEWESPEGAEDLGAGVAMEAMPWQGDEEQDPYVASEDTQAELAPAADILADEAQSPDAETVIEAVEDAVADDAPFSFRPGERLFERLSSKKMSASHLPDVETVEAAEAYAPEQIEPESDAPAADAPIGDEDDATLEDAAAFEDDLDDVDPLAGAEMSNIFDEDMLRDMVKDIIRQELQGVLGERITRNVRKLVRREIQRAISDINS